MRIHRVHNYSVIIPARNAAPTIERALRSVLGQTLPASEILVVDDNSTDRTVECASACGNSLIRILHSSRPRSAGAARKTGVANAKTQWIAFLDADDWWEPRKMETQLGMLESSKSAAVCASAYVLHRHGRSIPRGLTGPGVGVDLGTHLFCDLGEYHTSTLVFSNNLLREVPFFEEQRRHQDWSLLLALENKGATFLYAHDLLSHRECGRTRAADSGLSRAFLDAARPHLAPRAQLGFLINILLYKLILEKSIGGIKQCLSEAVVLTSRLGASALPVWACIAAANARHRLPRVFWRI
jgi:glycosyltransferase involved in cell wall biosynthesis